MRTPQYKINELVEVKILDTWVPAYIESVKGGDWYMCNLGLRSDLFFAKTNIRSMV